MVEFYFLAFSRSPLRTNNVGQNTKFWFSQESNSRLAHIIVGVRGYLLIIDHSGDEGMARNIALLLCYTAVR